MKIYFVRHGESIDATENKHQKWDAPLSERGKKQAQYLAKRLKNIQFDVIYSSPWPRAYQTAQTISSELGINIEVMENLKEHRRPSVQEGLEKDHEITLKIKQLAKQNTHDPDWKYEDGESVRELWQRVNESVNHLVEHHQNQTVLVVSHGNFIRAFLARILSSEEVDLNLFYTFRKHFMVHNTAVSLVEYDGERFRVVFWNDVAHIESPEDATV